MAETRTISNSNTCNRIQKYRELRAQIADLEAQEKALRKELVKHLFEQTDKPQHLVVATNGGAPVFKIVAQHRFNTTINQEKVLLLAPSLREETFVVKYVLNSKAFSALDDDDLRGRVEMCLTTTQGLPSVEITDAK